MASIDICYAVAAYKPVAESENYPTPFKHSLIACADSGITGDDYQPHLADVYHALATNECACTATLLR
jgi:hypothetical protein